MDLSYAFKPKKQIHEYTENRTRKRYKPVFFLRTKYQGIQAPVLRYDDDFDAGAKYHVAADVPYIRYFVAHILEYSFYKEMCLASNNYDPADPEKPLFKCDFSAGPDAPKAGQLLK